MPFESGLYKVDFATHLGESAGLVYLSEGKLRGGDAAYAWVGSYVVDGSFEAEVNIFRHSPSETAASVFGVEKAVVQLSGKVHGQKIAVKGLSSAAPDVAFTGQIGHVQPGDTTLKERLDASVSSTHPADPKYSGTARMIVLPAAQNTTPRP